MWEVVGCRAVKRGSRARGWKYCSLHKPIIWAPRTHLDGILSHLDTRVPCQSRQHTVQGALQHSCALAITHCLQTHERSDSGNCTFGTSAGQDTHPHAIRYFTAAQTQSNPTCLPETPCIIASFSQHPSINNAALPNLSKVGESRDSTMALSVFPINELETLRAITDYQPVAINLPE